MEDQNVSATPLAPAPSKKPGKPVSLQVFLAIILAVILIAAGSAGAYYLMQKTPAANKPVKTIANANTNANMSVQNNCLPGSLDCVNTTTGELPPQPTSTEESPATSSGDQTAGNFIDDSILWNEPVPIASLKLFIAKENSSVKYYKVGQFTSGKYSGYDLIIVNYQPNAPAMTLPFCRFVRKGSQLVMLQKYCSYSVEDSGFNPKKFTIDADYTIKGLSRYPKTIQITDPNVTLERDEWVEGLFSTKNLKPAFVYSDFGQAYATNGYFKEFSDIFTRYGFYFRAPDGTAIAYKLKINFMDGDESMPKISWYDGTVSTSTYKSTDMTGCGSVNYSSVVNPAEIKSSDLEISGKTVSGDDIFTLVNPEHPLLEDIYNSQYQVYGGAKKVSYDEFIAGKPVFFWHDQFRRLIKFQNSSFGPFAECGKPVIYLYPTQTANVSVKLAPQGGFSYTEPAYKNGWSVIAEPDGKLTDMADNKVYPYLFWEGRGGMYQSPNKGFVLAQKDVHNFLVEKLAKLGLNAKEAADFIEFWEPKMQGSPYYFVSFYGNAVMNQLAPLSISPKPDTVIRILMDFQPLAKPIRAESYDIKTPQRSGFTVVEWGGVLR